MKIVPLKSWFILVLLSTNTLAEVLPIQIGGGATVSVLDDNAKETEMIGYRASLGYQASDNVLFELGYADFSAFSGQATHNLQALMAETEFSLPVSEYAALYAGIGGAFSSDKTNLTSSIGLKYQLNQHWHADISYQGIFSEMRHDADLYAFNTQLFYRFSVDSTPPNTENVIVRPSADIRVEHQANSRIKATNLLAETTPDKQRSCQTEPIEYRVVSGDHLLQISRMFDTDLKLLLDINSNLNSRNLNLIYPGETILIPRLGCSD